MIKNKPTRLPPFTIGGDAYQKIDEICSPYGRSAVMIGGETALAQAQAKIRHGCSPCSDWRFCLWQGGQL